MMVWFFEPQYISFTQKYPIWYVVHDAFAGDKSISPIANRYHIDIRQQC